MKVIIIKMWLMELLAPEQRGSPQPYLLPEIFDIDAAAFFLRNFIAFDSSHSSLWRFASSIFLNLKTPLRQVIGLNFSAIFHRVPDCL